jgi:carbon storage regulator
MLVLARSAGQSVVLDERIVVTVLDTKGGIVRLGVAAPDEVAVRRGELARRTDERPGQVAADEDRTC